MSDGMWKIKGTVSFGDVSSLLTLAKVIQKTLHIYIYNDHD